MAEYIDRKKIHFHAFFDAGDYSQATRCINNVPIADVIERSKIDKAIKEIEREITEVDYHANKLLGSSHGMRKAIEIFKKNIGE